MIYLILLAGIWVGLYLTHNLIFFIILFIILFAFIYFRFSKKICLIFCASFLIGVSLSYVKFDIPKEQFVGVVSQSNENYYILYDGLERYYISEYDNDKEVGDILNIVGNKKQLYFANIESSFDFKTHLNDKGIYYEIEVKEINFIHKNFIKLKAFRNYFLSHYDEHVKGAVSTMLFGINDDSSLNDQLSSLHLYRLFNAGGVFINAFLMFFTFLYKIKFKEDKAKLFSFITLVPYFILAINKFSVFRVFFVQLLILINKYVLKNKFNYLEVISISALLLLVFNYHLAYQDGFILGYLISILFYFISSSFHFVKKKNRKLVNGLFIFLFFIPFEIEYYNEVSLLSPFICIALLPLFILINIFNLLCLYGLPIYFIPSFLLSCLNNFFNAFKINTFNLYSADLSIYVAFILECILVLTFYYYSIRFKPLYKLFSFIYLNILLVNFLPINRLIYQRIYFIDVGQGDSTLIVDRNKTILIDTGGNMYKDIAKECLIPFFKKEKIYKIDHLIITHKDYDHNGALDSLRNNFNVKNIVDYNDFPLKVNDLVIDNLNPLSHILPRGENDASYVLNFDFIGFNFLLMGDASSKIEKNILNKYPSLDCDILKVGHHGSSTSTSFEFIKQISPIEAIISCGENNRYNHPAFETLSVLSYFDVNVRRTDIEGTICYVG